MNEIEKQVEKMAATITKMQIESAAASAGAIDGKAVKEVEAIVNKNVKAEIDAATGNVKLSVIDPATTQPMKNVDGTEMSIGQFVGQLKAAPETGHLFKGGAVGKAKTGGIETETNPWHRDSIHLGRQAHYLKNEPKMAAAMQAAAKGTLIDNPFSKEGFNLTRQSQVLRDCPALAERMRAEVAGPEPNPFMAGPTFNLTRQVLLYRSDRQKHDRMKAEAALANPSKKDYRFTPPPGSFKRRVFVEGEK
jgi:hypothetical protein